MTEGRLIEITGGLASGDTIVTSGQNKLQPGGTVTVDNAMDITKAEATMQGKEPE